MPEYSRGSDNLRLRLRGSRCGILEDLHEAGPDATEEASSWLVLLLSITGLHKTGVAYRQM
jgi:hypothetical protein